jgi:hypothetical protein
MLRIFCVSSPLIFPTPSYALTRAHMAMSMASVEVPPLPTSSMEMSSKGLSSVEESSHLACSQVASVRGLDRRGSRIDPAWSRHLQLQVCVVGRNHEFGIAWPSKYDVVGP